MFEVLYLGRGSCGTWEEEGAGGGENTAVAEPEFTCTHMTYTFTYMIVFTCLYFVLHVCTRYLYRIRYQYTRRNTIIPCTGGGENERAFWYLYTWYFGLGPTSNS